MSNFRCVQYINLSLQKQAQAPGTGTGFLTTGIDSGNRALVVALGSRQEQTNKQTHRTHQNQSPTFSATFGHFNFIFTFNFIFIFCLFYDIFFAPELAVDFHPGRVELLSHELAVCDVVI